LLRASKRGENAMSHSNTARTAIARDSFLRTGVFVLLIALVITYAGSLRAGHMSFLVNGKSIHANPKPKNTYNESN
jgi:hypothetical protein